MTKNFISKPNTIYLVSLFFLASSSFIISLKSTLIQENFNNQIINFYIYSYFIIFLQLIFIIIVLINKKLPNFLKTIFFSFLIFFNFYTAILSTSSFFANSVKELKLMYFFLSFLIIYLINIFIIKKIKILQILCFLYLALNIIYFFELQSFHLDSRISVKKLEIKDKRNLYIYSFESLIPEIIINKHLGIKTNLKNLNQVKKFKIFKNNFSDSFPTKESINSILYLNPQEWRDRKLYKQNYFTGKHPSPLFNVFKKNGYKIITGFKYPTFGKNGPSVDEYYTENSLNYFEPRFSFCYGKANKLSDWYFQLYNFCKFKYGKDNIDYNIEKKVTFEDFHEFAVNQIYSGSEPTLKWFHMIPYDHPDSSDRNYISTFEEGIKEAVFLIEKIFERVKIYDPNSVVIIFGDHNLMTWRFSSDQKLNQRIKNNYKNKDDYVFMDTFPVFGGIYDNSEFCLENTNDLKLDKFMTNSKMVNSIIACYAGTKTLFSPEMIYKIYKRNGDYENYLYE